MSRSEHGVAVKNGDLSSATQSIQTAEGLGVDVALLQENLAKSLEERFEAHDAALKLVLALEEGRAAKGEQSEG